MKINRLEDNKFTFYEFSTLKEMVDKFDEWKLEFITDNNVKDPQKDIYFKDYCDELNIYIDQFKEIAEKNEIKSKKIWGIKI